VFTIYDATPAPLCQVVYDLSEPGVLTPTNAAWTTSVPGITFYEAWDFAPRNGWTNCPQLSHPNLPGMTDIRQYFETVLTGLAIGEMDGLALDLEADVGTSDWLTL